MILTKLTKLTKLTISLINNNIKINKIIGT